MEKKLSHKEKKTVKVAKVRLEMVCFWCCRKCDQRFRRKFSKPQFVAQRRQGLSLIVYG